MGPRRLTTGAYARQRRSGAVLVVVVLVAALLSSCGEVADPLDGQAPDGFALLPDCSPATGTPATGTPATGTPATGTPAAGSPGARATSVTSSEAHAAEAHTSAATDAVTPGPNVLAVPTVPRLWIEANLDAIRRDIPAPTVHARNLWHLSAARWDVHAAYQTSGAAPYFDHDVTIGPRGGSAPPRDVHGSGGLTAEGAAVSYAAHALLTWRYEVAVGGDESLEDFDQLLADLCLPAPSGPLDGLVEGSPEWVGRSIANDIIDFGLDDGSEELNGYVDLSYQPVNDPLIVADGEISMSDPNRWQPLQLTKRITQNGIEQDGGLQVFIGSNWGWVESFALPEPDSAGVTIAVPEPPMLGEQSFVDAAIEMVDFSDRLGGQRGAELIDIGPSTAHPDLLGRSESAGDRLDRATGEPYAPNLVPLADYGRVVAEYWADGPDSETPPGHWNTLAIASSDRLDRLRWSGDGPELSRYEWDLRLFFTLNGALHDAAIAVWGTKRAHDYVRPISIVRHLGSAGELPEVAGLVERVTARSSAQGERHEGLVVGELAVRSWLGPVPDPTVTTAGVGWLPAGRWLPYQRATFVSPAFAAYVSGHSGFSRAAAEVLTEATGSAYFPDGLMRHRVQAGALLHEEGPSIDVELQWATYRDAADEAGISRRYGGIHVRADDLAGRDLGAEVGRRAWAHAQQYWTPEPG